MERHSPVVEDNNQHLRRGHFGKQYRMTWGLSYSENKTGERAVLDLVSQEVESQVEIGMPAVHKQVSQDQCTQEKQKKSRVGRGGVRLYHYPSNSLAGSCTFPVQELCGWLFRISLR